MSSKADVLATQCEWARGLGYQPDARGYLEVLRQNLRSKLSRKAQSAFEKGSGGELKDRPARNGRPARPAKLKALHSSAALAVNFFDYWSDRDPTPLGEALGIDGLESIEFEAQHPTGLEGTPPNLDVELRLQNGSIVGVESKFTEWLTPKRKKAGLFKSKYFPREVQLWRSRNLTNCQTLAEALQQQNHAYVYLNAPQLLKHALGPTTTNPGRCSLLYLYYEGSGKAAETHRSEITNFAYRLELEMSFRAMSYQDFFGRLQIAAAGHDEYLTYLSKRYFAHPPR